MTLSEVILIDSVDQKVRTKKLCFYFNFNFLFLPEKYLPMQNKRVYYIRCARILYF